MQKKKGMDLQRNNEVDTEKVLYCVCLKMQGGRVNRDPFFGNGGPFSGFGSQRSLLSGFFGGRDPFDDPFFTRPFGGLLESSFFGSSGNPFANMHPSPFDNMHPSGYIEQQVPEPKKSRGPIIEELDSDNEKTEGDEEKKENPRKHGRRSKEPFVEDPDDEAEVRKSKHLQYRNDYNSMALSHNPKDAGSLFRALLSLMVVQMELTTLRPLQGGQEVTFEESKEADSATGQATHRVSRGLHNKGHSFTRKLKSDGRVDTMQTLHNLNEDELSGFEEAWKGNAGKHLPGWTGSFTGIDNTGTRSSGQNAQARGGGWALPSSEGSQHSKRIVPDTTVGAGSSHIQKSGRRKGSSDVQQLLQEAEERASAAGNEPPPKITLDHVSVSFARSGGPGGQNVNKVNTKVDMRFNVKNAYWLSERIRERIMQMEKNRINKDGEIVISSTKTRTQKGNIDDALAKLQAIIDVASYVPPPPSEEQKKKIAKMAAIGEQKRLKSKKALSDKKAFRRSRDSWD
ncbi:LOW QUALITY PROTEIN: hypothetical protein NC653_008949 [Populus alba x Populus x berolinensis]|uniref:Prokaryotic-type class I peptide chain release factors domain-containing protein n=1 Tax=Populus alba x Populus x berolinensis TaxID=444605 RepID=A0AAD6W939_9ROSI|nr:LOW QUALITY PROTEIN: hypothetical protein NC653_008949 [Populus alba x Populus x berolinensis]